MKYFAAAAFASAALLFLLQPVAGRALLPRFGGSASVWTVCLLFFQTGLLAAYALAHWLGKRTRLASSAVYIASIAAGWAMLAYPATWGAEQGGDNPTLQVLMSLLARYGAGYVAVGMSSPLLQTWLRSLQMGASPYWLYAYSNVGALVALVSYPTLVEPHFSLQAQHDVLGWLFAATLLLAGVCLVHHSRANPAGSRNDLAGTEVVASDHRGWRRGLTWFALAFGGSATLLGVTNEMCREVAVVPFLWILPLTIYLSTFIYSFRKNFSSQVQTLSLVLAIGVLLGTAILAAGNALLVWFQVVLLSLLLLAVCAACHGLLAITKPPPGRLTGFYLILAAGGAAGGGFVALASPRLFTGYDELPWVLAALCPVAAALLAAEGQWRRNPAIKGILAGLILAATGAITLAASPSNGATVVKRRNFYGVLQVIENTDVAGRKRTLRHGRVMHGVQYLEAEKRSWPTAYYGPTSGAGMELQKLPQGSTVAILGLGVGTLAAYARPADHYVFYEIDPDVIEIAKTHFGYLGSCAGQVTIQQGDARILMQRETSAGMRRRYDAIAVDVFTSGAIPLHMITYEAAALYRENLKSSGRIMFHISNQTLDLEPVVRGLAAKLAMRCLRVDSTAQPRRGTSGATWMILSDEAGESSGGDKILWTDEHASLWQVLRWAK